jgi:hypothetical protein
MEEGEVKERKKKEREITVGGGWFPWGRKCLVACAGGSQLLGEIKG